MRRQLRLGKELLLGPAVMECAHEAVSEGVIQVFFELTVGCESAEFRDVLGNSFRWFLSASVKVVSLHYDQRLRLEVILQHLG